MMSRTFVTLAIFLMSSVWCLAQRNASQYDYVIAQLDNRNGLSNNNVTGVFQDSDKLLWLNTWDGLKIYNGLSFNSFKSDQSVASHLPNNVVTKVLEDRDHNIWICTEEGVTKYDKTDGAMNHYFYSHEKAKGKSADYNLAISKANDIVCGLRLDSVLYRYDPMKNDMAPIRFLVPNIGKVAKIEFDEYGRLWTLSLGGDLRVFKKTPDGYRMLRMFRHGINIFHIANHRIFIASKTKLCDITPDFQIRELANITHTVRDIQYFQGHYFVAWLFKGIQEYDREFRPVDGIRAMFPVLKEIQVNSLTQINGNSLWLATVGRGIITITRRPNTFGLVRDPSGIVPSSNIQNIRKVGREIWLATLNNGIVRLNDDKGNPGAVSIHPVSSNSESGNSYYTLADGVDGNVYIGSEGFGLTVYDPLTGRFTPWNAVKDAPYDPDFFSVRAILPQADSSVFVGFNGGVYHLKVHKRGNGDQQVAFVKPVKVDGHFLKPGNNMVSALENFRDHILIGYRFAGLAVLNKKNGKTSNIRIRNGQKTIRGDNILSIFLDRRERVWVGTSSGLYWIAGDDLLDPHPKFFKLEVRNGLPDNNVRAITEDDHGNIWISTNQGLAKISEDTQQVIQYNYHDGLQNAEFNDNAVFKDDRGILYFGGVSGLNHFDPGKVTSDKTLTNLLITDVNMAGKPAEGVQLLVIKPRTGQPVKEFHLIRNENYFSLNVQPADGYTNRKFQCKYYLEGYDAKWSEPTGSTRIEYRGLPPGDYTLHIKWSNGQGQWSPELSVFRMEVKQYLWLNTFAKLLYLVIIAAAIILYYRFKRRSRELKDRLALENLIRAKEQKLFEEKMDLFTNITHELQTPLTLILGSLERFLFKNDINDPRYKGANFLHIANHEAFRLQYLTHQLLEYRRAEAGYLTIQPSNFNVSNLLLNIAELFEPIGEQNELRLSVDIATDLQVNNDKDKIEKIVFNLLSNAFKYTRAKNEILFKLSAVHEQDAFRITVANSGYEGATERLDVLFEQFYTVNTRGDSRVSSGIGLAFCKQLAELLGGTISVSARDNWIEFNVVLPFAAPEAATGLGAPISPSDKPSYLVKSAIGSQRTFENRVKTNNELALLENLSDAGRKTILIVEDEPAIRHLLREILKDAYVVYEAENGSVALDLLQRIKPNLIISDVLMDGMDGLKLCENIKNTLETCHIPCLLLSALASAKQRVEGFEAGADAYLTKPFSSAALLKKVGQQIQYREQIHNYFRADSYRESSGDTGLLTDDQVFLEKVIRVIENDLSNPELDAAFLENAMAMSRMTLYRKIKGFTNMTPGELIKHLRLKKAAYLLRSTQLNVSEVYYQTGFNNQSYFFREFKRVYSLSPKEFRERRSMPIT